MAEEEYTVVTLNNQFYRDGFGKVIFIIAGISLAIIMLIALSIYIYLHKPTPKLFAVDTDWHTQKEVPVKDYYLSTPDLLQWVSDSLTKAFTLDFVNYDSELAQALTYFTASGANVFKGQINNYANYDTLLAYKMFVNAEPASAPIVSKQGPLSGRYSWWVQMPLTLSYKGANKSYNQTLTLQVLVVRISNLNNLNGVSIENVIVANSTGNPLTTGQ